jgi:hypothetical protein
MSSGRVTVDSTVTFRDLVFVVIRAPHIVRISIATDPNNNKIGRRDDSFLASSDNGPVLLTAGASDHIAL